MCYVRICASTTLCTVHVCTYTYVHVYTYCNNVCTYTVKPVLKDTSEMQNLLEQGTNVLSHLKSLTLTCVHLNPPKEGHFHIQDSLLWSQWCLYYRGFTVQDSLLWSQWCPYYRGFTVQDSLLWSQWCPYYRGFTVQDSLL